MRDIDSVTSRIWLLASVGRTLAVSSICQGLMDVPISNLILTTETPLLVLCPNACSSCRGCVCLCFRGFEHWTSASITYARQTTSDGLAETPNHLQARKRRLNVSQLANRVARTQLQIDVYRCLAPPPAGSGGGFFRRGPQPAGGPSVTPATYSLFAEDDSPEVKSAACVRLYID